MFQKKGLFQTKDCSKKRIVPKKGLFPTIKRIVPKHMFTNTVPNKNKDRSKHMFTNTRIDPNKRRSVQKKRMVPNKRIVQQIKGFF